MLNLLDIAWPGRPRTPRIIIDPDTAHAAKPKVDSVTVPDGTDSIVPQELLDSCKENVLDTLHSAVNWLNGAGPDSGNSTLLCTSIVVLASLSCCFFFVWAYRRQLQRNSTI